jgi:single-strand DNA-binding protein
MSSNNINSVVVNGRLTHDPKLYGTSGEKAYALLRIAINRRIGKDKQRAIYYDVKVWNNLAKVCVEHLRKGGLISVQGHLDQYDKPATEEKDKERWNFITAEQVEFCSRPKAEAGEAAGAGEDE